MYFINVCTVGWSVQVRGEQRGSLAEDPDRVDGRPLQPGGLCDRHQAVRSSGEESTLIVSVYVTG